MNIHENREIRYEYDKRANRCSRWPYLMMVLLVVEMAAEFEAAVAMIAVIVEGAVAMAAVTFVAVLALMVVQW